MVSGVQQAAIGVCDSDNMLAAIRGRHCCKCNVGEAEMHTPPFLNVPTPPMPPPPPMHARTLRRRGVHQRQQRLVDPQLHRAPCGAVGPQHAPRAPRAEAPRLGRGREHQRRRGREHRAHKRDREEHRRADEEQQRDVDADARARALGRPEQRQQRRRLRLVGTAGAAAPCRCSRCSRCSCCCGRTRRPELLLRLLLHLVVALLACSAFLAAAAAAAAATAAAAAAKRKSTPQLQLLGRSEADAAASRTARRCCGADAGDAAAGATDRRGVAAAGVADRAARGRERFRPVCYRYQAAGQPRETLHDVDK